jgi:hypothetical protein
MIKSAREDVSKLALNKIVRWFTSASFLVAIPSLVKGKMNNVG